MEARHFFGECSRNCHGRSLLTFDLHLSLKSGSDKLTAGMRLKMNLFHKLHSRLALVTFGLAIFTVPAAAQDIGTLNAQINAVAPQVSSALGGNASAAEQ